jgi:hypothetical protein
MSLAGRVFWACMITAAALCVAVVAFLAGGWGL